MLSCRPWLGVEKGNGQEPRAESGVIVLYHNKDPRKLLGTVPPVPWPGDKSSWLGLSTFCGKCQKLFLACLSSQLLSETGQMEEVSGRAAIPGLSPLLSTLSHEPLGSGLAKVMS